jgi:hypothetical protein
MEPHFTIDMEPLFTIEEIRNYILSQDSLGDVLYNLNEKNIIEANLSKDKDEDHDDG